VDVKPGIVRLFRERGIRCTKQRYALMEYLTRAARHTTVDHIFRAVNRKSRPHVSRATVYNNVRYLVETGLVRQVALEERAARYEANVKRHHHFVCDQCGRIEDVEWFEVPGLARRPELEERSVREYELLVRGICKRCSSS
jgi:Fur family transcriptional regulator, peroxide stress response regulator